MAKIDTINIRGSEQPGVNLTHSVGLGATNRRSDILLVQALFYYLYFDKEANLKGVALPHIAPALLESFSLTGFLDPFTLQTIMYFQATHSHRLLSVDAIIEPAKYQGRVIKDTNKPLMTITYLHLLARKRELATGSGDYIKSIRQIMAYFQVFDFSLSILRRKP